MTREHALYLFNPTPVFKGLIDEVTPGAKVCLRAANRVGKTRGLAHCIATLMVNHPGYRCRIIAPTNHHCHNVLGQYLAEFLGPYLHPKSYYVHGKGWNGGRARSIILNNGSICEMRSLEDRPDAHSGTSCHLVAFDEIPTRAHYTENVARVLDTMNHPRGGSVIVAATMVGRPCEWLRSLVQGSDPDPAGGRTEHGTGWVQIVAEFSAENCPFYSSIQVNKWIETMRASPWAYAQRVKASWEGGLLDGRLFVSVDESTFAHSRPDGRARIGLGFDHGTIHGRSCAVLIAYKGGRLWAIDEVVCERPELPEVIAAEVVAMLHKHGIEPREIDLCVADVGSHIGRSSAYSGWRNNDALEAAFRKLNGGALPFVITTADKTPGSVDYGLRLINYAARRGSLKIHPRASCLAQSMRFWKGGKKGEDGKLSHIADAFRYVVAGALGTHRSYATLKFS